MGLKIIYPVTWPAPTRLAAHEQSVNTIAALARHGHEVTLLLPRGRRDPEMTAEAIRRHFGVTGDFAVEQKKRRWPGENFAATGLWQRALFRDPRLARYDLLLTRIPTIQALGSLCPIPFAFDHYRRWPDDVPFLRPFLARTVRQKHLIGIVAHSRLAAASYARFGVPADKLLVAHNGVPETVARAGIDRGDARRTLGLGEAGLTAVYAGRINGRKGLDQLLALAALRPGVRFFLVGSEGEGEIERQARILGNVGIVPWQAPEGLGLWLAAADILVIPASDAPLERHRDCVLPIKTFAYLAAGRPILAPDTADVGEVLEDRVNALLVAPGRPAEAAAALDALLADPALAARLGDNARRLAASLTWDGRAERLTRFFERRLDEMRAPAGRAAAQAGSRMVSTASGSMSG